MNPEVYKRHIEFQSNHWWFQARKEIIGKIIKKYTKNKINILDYGSGSGVNIEMLSKYGFVYIYEPHRETNLFLKKKYKNKKKFKVLNSLNNKKFDLIVMADVLEHIKYDKKQVKKLKKNLTKNGSFLITVPAYKFLYSKKDIILGHFRRYNKKNLSNVFDDFKIIKLSYFNFLLFVPISILIIIFKFMNYNFINDVEKTPKKYINELMFQIFRIEKQIISVFNLPFGISLVGLFKKK